MHTAVVEPSDLFQPVPADPASPTATGRSARVADDALNAICPYWTMFPLEFPLRALADGRPGSGYWHAPKMSRRLPGSWSCRRSAQGERYHGYALRL